MSGNSTGRQETAGYGPTAAARPGEADPADGISILVVRVADERCAVRLDDVVEVLPAARVEPLPGAPAAVLGVLDLRSDLVVVLDGHRCLGLDGDSPLRPSDRFVVLRVGDERRALRVDAADDVADIPAAHVTAVTSVAPEIATSAGIARLADGLLIIHDPSRFLSAADTASLHRALADRDGSTAR